MRRARKDRSGGTRSRASNPALANFSRGVEDWAATSNPFYSGPNADLLAMIPFTLLAILLYLVGRDKVLAPRRVAAIRRN